MAGSGSEKRKRRHKHSARFDDAEDALIRETSDRTGVSIGSLIRYALLNQQPPRAKRDPTMNEQTAAYLLGMLGRYVAALKAAAAKGTPGLCDEEVKAACRDATEMRALWFQVFGREP